MNVLSKEAFAEVVKYKTCDVIVHPWAKTCTDGILKLIWSSLLGSSKFCIALAAVSMVLNIYEYIVYVEAMS